MKRLLERRGLFFWQRRQAEAFEDLGADPAIRSMRLSDLREVLKIERDIYDFPWPKRAFEDCLRLGYHCILLADPSARIGAYGVMEMRSAEAHICNVSVARTLHRKGAGRVVMTALLRVAQQKGLRSAYLEVRPSNQGAQAFYKALGFRHGRTKRNYYRAAVGFEDAWVFERELADGVG